MSFWERLSETAYNTWKANKFKHQAIDRIKSTLVDEPIEAAQDLPGQAAAGWSSFQRNYMDPAKGLLRQAHEMRAQTDPMAWQTGQKTKLDLSQTATSWNKAGERYRAQRAAGEVGGAQEFGYSTAVDPLTYVGGYGKAVGALPKLSRAGKAISAIEQAPTGLLNKTFEGIGAAASAAGKHIPILRPSGGSRARMAGEVGAEAARSALARSGDDLEEARKLYARRPAPMPEGLVASRPGDYAGTPWGATLESAPKSSLGDLRDLFDPDTAWRIMAGAARKATTPEEFIRYAREGYVNPATGRRGLQGAQGTYEAQLRQMQPDWMTKAERIWDIPTRVWTRGVLGSPMYPALNVTEDVLRSILGGVGPGKMSADQARLALEGAEGAPSWLFTNPQHAPYKLWDWLPMGGRAWIDESAQHSAPVRRNFFVQTYERALQAARASGVEPVKAKLDALKLAATAMERNYPTYTNESGLTGALQKTIPFFHYEAQRWPYLARKGAEYPGLAAGYERYRDESDRGYLPGAFEMQVNPTRGSVLGGLSVLNRPDFPTYAQGKAGKVEEFQELLGKGGFYFGPQVMAGAALTRALGRQPVEPGSLIPGGYLARLQAVEGLGALPGVGDLPGLKQVSDLAVNLEDTLAGERFRDYYIAKELAIRGIDPATATEAQRTDAAKNVARRRAAITMSNVLRFHPEEETKYRQDQLAEAIAAGIPEDAARIAAKRGNPVGATDAEGVPFLNVAERRDVYEKNPEWEPWRQVTEPLKRPDERRALEETRSYFAALEQIDQRTMKEMRQLYDRWNAGSLSGVQFRDARSRIMTQAAAARAQAKEMHQGRGALVTSDQRTEFYRRTGRDAPKDAPEDERAHEFYAIQVERDPATGLPDFQQWHQRRDAFLAQLDPQTKDYVLNQFPRKRYQGDPVVAAGEADYARRVEGMRGYFDTPRYLGLSSDDVARIDRATKLMSAIRARFPGLPREQAEALAGQQEPRGTLLARYARILRNPKRAQYLQQNPDVADLLSDVALSDLADLPELS